MTDDPDPTRTTSDRDRPSSIELGGFKTLPLYVRMGKTMEGIPQFSKGKVRWVIADPTYSPPKFAPTTELLYKLSNDAIISRKLAEKWIDHLWKYKYFAQFEEDTDKQLVHALHSHTETLSILCDARLRLDPERLWQVFDGAVSFANVHSEYREEHDKEGCWEYHAKRLQKIWEQLSNQTLLAQRLTQRIATQIALRTDDWAGMPPIQSEDNPKKLNSCLKVFYCYSHEDEKLRDRLNAHLTTLERAELISGWHDRRLTGGNEWAGVIDKNLKSADIILLLISANFIASDYCYDVEMALAMQRHDKRYARVIPVILRDCDWKEDTPFSKLQALPKDGKAVTSWSNTDAAFTDVAKGIRAVVKEIQADSLKP